MNNTMESIISPQNYDTAAEESISMYFSFSSTIVNEKTIIGEQLKHTINDNNDDGLNEENKENLNTVIKKPEGIIPPFRATSKNILQEFKTASATSTPTYKMNPENIEENMKSLGIFSLDDGVNENFIEKRVEIIETEQIMEKEEMVHVEESIITIESDESVQIIKEIENENKTGHKNSSLKLLENSFEAKISDNRKRNTNPVPSKNENAENFLEENKENIEHFPTKARDLSNIKEFSEDEETTSTLENLSNGGKCNGSNKEHPSEVKSVKKIPRNARLSIPKIRYSLMPPSEPDLERNKPSRIAGSKRFSSSKLNQAQIATQIPRLLCAVMTPTKKVPSNDRKSPSPSPPPNKKSPLPNKKTPTSCTKEDKKVDEINARKSLVMPSTRKSMLALPTNKRLSIIKQRNPSIALSPRGPRKSGIVKTTLNSPAIKRNIRKSLTMPPPSRVLGNKGRKSIFPATSKNSNLQAPITPSRMLGNIKGRKSMLPATSKNSNLQAPISPSRMLGNIKGRKSMFPATSKNSNLQAPSKSSGREDLKTLPEVNGKNKAKDTPTKPPSNSTLNHENFSCDKCLRTFRLLSTLEAHKKTHSTILNKLELKCKHCDKKFEVPKALENHLLEKCTKILASERRKLLTKISSSFEKATSNRNNNLGNGKEVGSDLSPSIDSIGSFVNKSENDNDSQSMPPPSASSSSSSTVSTSSVKAKNLVPMKGAHSGVYWTPNKPVVCHPCKIPFDNAFCYTEHVLSHSSSSPDS